MVDYNMKRQSRMKAEVLTNVFLKLNSDSTFTGRAGCNDIFGKLSVKGTSIKFNSIGSTKKTCAKAEEETWVLKLLQQTVSNYSVTSNTLLLRDGSSNVVFEAKKN
jgi:heat shock protein HslJ